MSLTNSIKMLSSKEVSDISEYILYHHGIKGMRWGVRRYQNSDGSLTPAGKKRYYNNPDLISQKSEVDAAKKKMKESVKEIDRASYRYKALPTNANYKAYKDAQKQYALDRQVYKNTKLKYDTNKEVSRIRDKDIQFSNKSKHRLKLEEQYKKMGMSDEEAQAAANNRIRTEKILVASAAVTVAACAAYVANKSIKNRVDGIIKSGDTLQRIEMQDTNGKLHDMFYVAKGEHDSKRYEGLLGMARKNATGHAYLMKLEAKSDIKVASKDNAAKIFGDLYKNDPQFRLNAYKYVKEHFAGHNQLDPNNLSNKNIKKLYENFNANIMGARQDGTGVDKRFYDKLKAAGYGAIQDINDMKYSGYNAKNPLIVFDNSSGNIFVRSYSELTGNDMNKKYSVEMLKTLGESFTKDFLDKGLPVTAIGLSGAAAVTYNTDPNDQYKNYKK